MYEIKTEFVVFFLPFLEKKQKKTKKQKIIKNERKIRQIPSAEINSYLSL